MFTISKQFTCGCVIEKRANGTGIETRTIAHGTASQWTPDPSTPTSLLNKLRIVTPLGVLIALRDRYGWVEVQEGHGQEAADTTQRTTRDDDEGTARRAARELRA
jgi:hypothetical protein